MDVEVVSISENECCELEELSNHESGEDALGMCRRLTAVAAGRDRRQLKWKTCRHLYIIMRPSSLQASKFIESFESAQPAHVSSSFGFQFSKMMIGMNNILLIRVPRRSPLYKDSNLSTVSFINIFSQPSRRDTFA